MHDESDAASTKLLWNGQQTVDDVRNLMRSTAGALTVAIQLPADLHHTLFVTLHPQAGKEEMQEVALEGGAELLRRIEEVPGIQAVSGLAELAEEMALGVRIESPSPRVILHSRT